MGVDSELDRLKSAVRENTRLRKKTSRALAAATGESLYDRRFSFWTWVEKHLIRPTATEKEFKSYYLPEPYEDEPKPSDPPPVASRADVRLLLAGRSVPRSVRQGGMLALADFEKEGWGFPRKTDNGWESVGHRYRMRLAMRRRRQSRLPDQD